MEKAAQDQKDDELFLTLLDRLERQGRNVSHKPTAPTYAPTMFSQEPTAKGTSKARFEAAMRRLFAADKIHVQAYGRPSRPASKIVAGARQ